MNIYHKEIIDNYITLKHVQIVTTFTEETITSMNSHY